MSSSSESLIWRPIPSRKRRGGRNFYNPRVMARVTAMLRWAKLREALEEARLRCLRGPGCEVVALDGRGEFRRRAEEAARLAQGKSGKPRRLEKGRRAVGGLDRGDHLGRQHGGQAESQVDGREQPRLD